MDQINNADRQYCHNFRCSACDTNFRDLAEWYAHLAKHWEDKTQWNQVTAWFDIRRHVPESEHRRIGF